MTHLTWLFLLTFSAAFIATVPPGLLNMNAAKTSVEKGRSNGVIFSLGVASMVIVQAYVAVVISKFLYRNPEVVEYLMKAALAVFAFFAVYFYRKGRKTVVAPPEVQKVSRKNSYFKGVFLASLNFLTIPYYSGLHTMWTGTGWIKFEVADVTVFLLGASLGTFTVLYLYTFYFDRMVKGTERFSRNSNYIISGLMVLLFGITIIRLWNY